VLDQKCLINKIDPKQQPLLFVRFSHTDYKWLNVGPRVADDHL